MQTLDWLQAQGGMADRVRRHDWSTTTLGPIDRWPPGLQSPVSIVLESGFPTALAWGTDLVTIYNDGLCALLDEKPDKIGRPFADLWREDWDDIAPLIDRTMAGQPTLVEDHPLHRRRPGDPEQAFFTFSFSPVRGTDGTVLGLMATVVETTRRARTRHDATDGADGETSRREGEAHRHVSVAEMRHRVRNILSVIRSVFTLTVQGGGSVEEVGDHFRGRLDALTRAQMAVTRNAGGKADLENLIRDELLSIGANDGPDLEIDGPAVELGWDAAETVGLAIHELTTNAVKYGALGVRGARLTIHWGINIGCGDPPRLILTWTEQGVPAIPITPNRRGFGIEMIEEALPYRLGAETTLEFLGGGLRCSISLPLAADEGSSKAKWKVY